MSSIVSLNREQFFEKVVLPSAQASTVSAIVSTAIGDPLETTCKKALISGATSATISLIVLPIATKIFPESPFLQGVTAVTTTALIKREIAKRTNIQPSCDASAVAFAAEIILNSQIKGFSTTF